MKKIALILSLIMSLSLVACTTNPETFSEKNEQKRSYTEKLNGDGSVDHRWYYKYFPDGEVSTSMRCIEDGTCVQRNEYTYNESKQKESETIYLLGKKASYTEFFYTEDGKISLEKKFLPDDISEKTYHYNSSGKEDFVETHNALEELVALKRCNYDDSGNLIEESFYNGSEVYTHGIKYTYQGSLCTAKEYINNYPDGVAREEYTYEGENAVKTLLFAPDGSRLFTDTAEYDGDVCIHRMRVDASNSIVYTWDAYFDSFLTLIG